MSGLRAALFDRSVWIVGLGSAVGYANTAASSWIVSALLKDRGIGVQQASLVVTAELLTMAITMIVLAPVARRFPRKAVTLGGLAAMIAIQALCVLADPLALLILLRAASGAAFGTLYTVAIINGVETRDPQRTFAGAAAIALAVGTLFNPLVGYGSAEAGLAGVVIGLGTYCLVFALPLLLLRFDEPAGDAAAAKGEALPPLDKVKATGALLLMALLTIATNGTLLFTVEIAARVGLAGAELGAGLALVSLLSAFGGVVASWIGTRFGTFPPLAGGLSLMGLSLAGMTRVADPAQFWCAVTLVVGLFWFLSPYIFGIAAAIDPHGRVASATGSMKILFSAFAAAIAGAVAARAGIEAVGLLALATCGVTVIMARIIVPLRTDIVAPAEASAATASDKGR